MNRIRLFILMALLIGPAANPPAAAADMRTWTSVSGATVQAQYVSMERGEIVLQGADGMQFTIRPDLLSEADQQYVRDQLGIQAAPSGATAEPAKPGMLDSRNIPGLNLKQADDARFVAFQTGSGADDVVYFIFDREPGADRYEIFQTYNPRARPHQQLQTHNGRNRRHEGDAYIEFAALTYTGVYDRTRAEHTVTISSGVSRPDLIWARIESRYETGRDTLEIHFAGTLNTDARTGHGEIPVFPLAMKAQPTIMRSQRGTGVPMVGTISALSDLVLVGPRRLIETFTVELEDSSGNIVETARVTARETPLFPRRLLWVYEASLQRAQPGQPYSAIIRGDLGPAIGMVENRTRLDVR